jgi:hypothetical protein
MSRFVRVIATCLLLGPLGCEGDQGIFTTGGADVPAEVGKTYQFGFDEESAGVTPDDFIVVLGDWFVQADGGSPSAPNLFRQTALHDGPEYPRVVVKDLTFTDLTVSVSCRAESGEDDQACGLMFRFEDSLNYYITRANALEDNVRLYTVIDGDREEIASADVEVAAGAWHTLQATARGSEITVSFNGQEVIRHGDDTFARGKIGLWTKADSVTAFDELTATAE